MTTSVLVLTYQNHPIQVAKDVKTLLAGISRNTVISHSGIMNSLEEELDCTPVVKITATSKDHGVFAPDVKEYYITETSFDS